MIPIWAQLAYLLAAVCFIVALKGLSSPRTARRGNLIGATGAAIACVTVFATAPINHVVPILAALAIGAAVGTIGAYRVQMTQMPQMVALFNGVGGGAAAIVAVLELHRIAADGSTPAGGPVELIAAAFTVVVGSVSFAGSIVTFLKLQELMTTKPVIFAGYPLLYVAARCGRLRRGLVWFPSMFPACCWQWSGAGWRPAGAAGRRCGRADRHLTLNAFTARGRGERLHLQTPCCWSPERSSAPPAAC